MPATAIILRCGQIIGCVLSFKYRLNSERLQFFAIQAALLFDDGLDAARQCDLASENRVQNFPLRVKMGGLSGPLLVIVFGSEEWAAIAGIAECRMGGNGF